ncbi:MAG: [FeFe] hydrogenase H-cluster maturation GTPase HydF [Clostridia bacterium]|nr:[FeFe] hydrogenase H-cluster maturation GTPase HydF [Clostridia bacterium]
MAGLNETPKGERLHIAFFGKRNAGKSSLINAFTGQELSIVSDTKGTTTDPVLKAMELLPLGPVMIIDTPGIDDEGELGSLRVQKAMQVIRKTDVMVIVTDCTLPLDETEQQLISLAVAQKIPYVIAYNKSDLPHPISMEQEAAVFTSSVSGEGIDALKQQIISVASPKNEERHIVADLLSPGDFVVLVVPLDKAAPKGRLILPQQQTIRDILEAGASAIVCRDSELDATLHKLGTAPRMVITDSQVFHKVDSVVPQDVPLTSFSILMARYKGDLSKVVEGVSALSALKDGDPILIAEGCTHHRQCEDIGTVKIPNLLRKKLGIDPEFHFASGCDFPENLSDYRLVIHCGGCTLTEREMQHRLELCKSAGVPVTNYGILLAHLNGILKRSVELFPAVAELL